MSLVVSGLSLYCSLKEDHLLSKVIFPSLSNLCSSLLHIILICDISLNFLFLRGFSQNIMLEQESEDLDYFLLSPFLMNKSFSFFWIYITSPAK